MVNLRNKPRASFRAVALVACTTALVALPGCSPTLPSREHVAVLALDPYVGRLRTMEVRLAGAPLRMLVDTGAGLTLVTPAVAERMGCKPQGRTIGWRMSGERVEFPLCGSAELDAGAHHRRLQDYGVFDLARVLPAGLPPLDGILGLDAFLDSTVVIELSRQRLIVEASGSTADAGWAEVPMRIASGIDGATTIAFLAASIHGGKQLWLELDSGNLDAVLLAPENGQAPRAAGAAGNDYAFTLGALVTDPLPVATRELLHDGALNAEFMERYDVRLDLAARRAWVRPAAPGPAR